MIKSPVLTDEAVRALARATLGGPNCSHEDENGLRELLTYYGNPLSLTDVSRHFVDGQGPNTFLVWYSLVERVQQITPDDIAQAYCVYHRPMVSALGKIFQTQGFASEYFYEMKKRGFVIGEFIDDLAIYLFSCLGKVGRVVRTEHSSVSNQYHRATVEVDVIDVRIHRGSRIIILKNVVMPYECQRECEERERRGLKPCVAIHFASAFTSLSDVNLGISVVDSPNLFDGLFQNLPQVIDYANWLGGKLTAFTEAQLGGK